MLSLETSFLIKLKLHFEKSKCSFFHVSSRKIPLCCIVGMEGFL